MLSRPEEAPPDPGLYAVLGIGSSATDEEIQRAYRRRAAQLAQSDGDITALRRLNAAYEVIGNPVRRAEYDQARATPAPQFGPSPPARPGMKAPLREARRRRPRQMITPRTS